MKLDAKAFAILVASCSGVAMALQGTINTALSKVIGLLQATFVVHFIGLSFVSLLLFVFKFGNGNLAFLIKAPWYTYLGGVLGVIIIYTVVLSIPVVGVAAATTFIILGQVLTAILVDCTGILGMNKFPFTWHKVIGTFLMAGGAWFLLKK
ncbi:MAG: DMT family transporter [Clostridiales bacterium]|nr:DMT family transporter [Clostridiales bacterium]MCF8021558.1 DMT family transporter [Clostridiales bacterium]